MTPEAEIFVGNILILIFYRHESFKVSHSCQMLLTFLDVQCVSFAPIQMGRQKILD